MKAYFDILELTRNAQDRNGINDAMKEAMYAELNGTISLTQSALLCIARTAMRKALRCKTFGGVYGLECGFTTVYAGHKAMDGNARWFFMNLLNVRRMHLFYQSDFGKSVHRLFSTHPKLIGAKIDCKLDVSGRRQ